jgi:hypothetical protein
MVNVAAALKEIDVDPRRGVVRAIQTVGENIAEATDPLGYANAVIVSLGGQEQLDFPTARIMAKALIEKAVNGEKFVPEQALEYAAERVEKLRKEHPWTFAQPADVPAGSTTTVVRAGKTKGRKAVTADGKSKKDQALKICNENSSLDNGALAKMISEQLGITYANAYYYASRVWKRPA